MVKIYFMKALIFTALTIGGTLWHVECSSFPYTEDEECLRRPPWPPVCGTPCVPLENLRGVR